MNLNIANAAPSDMTNRITDYSVDPMEIDGVLDQEETTYQCSRYAEYWGYFNDIAELKSAIIMKATWNVGKGYTSDPETTVILDHISGSGKDTFLDILFNMEVTKRIFGDAYAEIIIDEKSGTLLNLKPLPVDSMKIVVGKDGILKRYELTSKFKGKKLTKFKPAEVFHLSNNKLVDQIHGISDIDAIEKIILGDAESFDDIKKVMHRQAKPLIMFKLGTDDPVKISAFIQKMDEALNKGENIYIPDDQNAVSFDVIQVPVSPITLEWRNELRNKFYRTVQLPQIVFGSAGTTESGGKIEYLAHEQVFERDQKHLEAQVWNQLHLRINLVPPATLQQELQGDNAKDGAGEQTGFQPSDVTAGVGK